MLARRLTDDCCRSESCDTCTETAQRTLDRVPRENRAVATPIPSNVSETLSSTLVARQTSFHHSVSISHVLLCHTPQSGHAHNPSDISSHTSCTVGSYKGSSTCKPLDCMIAATVSLTRASSIGAGSSCSRPPTRDSLGYPPNFDRE